MKKIALLPGVRYQADQYLRYIYQNTNTKVKVFSTAPYFKFRDLKKEDYKFSPQPFKIISKVFGIKLSSGMKYVDSNIYENFLSNSLKKYDPDIIHAHATYGLNTFKKNMKKFKILDRACPHILTQIENLSSEYQKYNLNFSKPNQKNIDKQIEEYKISDKIIVNSKMTKSSFIENGIDEEKIQVVPISTNNKFEYNYKENNKEKKIFGFCGGAIIRKGLIYLIKAWIRNKEEKNKELWLRTDSNSIKSVPFLFNLINKRNDIKILSYLKDMNYFFSSIDALIHPAAEEGFGMTVIEAVKNGVPVISSKNVGVLDIINPDHVIVISENLIDNIHELINTDKEYFVKISKKIKNSINNGYYYNEYPNLSEIYSI